MTEDERDKAKADFLTALEKTGFFTEAIKAIPVKSAKTIYNWMDKDEQFAKAAKETRINALKECALDALQMRLKPHNYSEVEYKERMTETGEKKLVRTKVVEKVLMPDPSLIRFTLSSLAKKLGFDPRGMYELEAAGSININMNLGNLKEPSLEDDE